MLSDLYAFGLALLPHWWWFLTSGPAAVDRAMRNHSVAYSTWADKRWNPQARARIFQGFAVVGLFVAAFLAFRGEHQQLVAAQRLADQATGKRERAYPPAYFKAAVELHDKLGELLATHAGSWIWIGYVDNPSSVNLASEIWKNLKRPTLQIQSSASPEGDVDGEGITLFLHNRANPTTEDRKVTQAFLSSGFSNLKFDELPKDPEYAQEFFGVYVSYPPR